MTTPGAVSRGRDPNCSHTPEEQREEATRANPAIFPLCCYRNSLFLQHPLLAELAAAQPTPDPRKHRHKPAALKAWKPVRPEVSRHGVLQCWVCKSHFTQTAVPFLHLSGIGEPRQEVALAGGAENLHLNHKWQRKPFLQLKSLRCPDLSGFSAACYRLSPPCRPFLSVGSNYLSLDSAA